MNWLMLLSALASATGPAAVRVRGTASVTILTPALVGKDYPLALGAHASQLGCDPASTSGSCRPLVLVEYE